jgi:hypothetical protein
MERLQEIFNEEALTELFPASRSNDFFEALFGDADEGAYDIRLRFDGHDPGTNSLRFYLDLHERPGCCLACNLTYGLPEVFSRHPVINIKGLVQDIEERLAGQATCTDWQLGTTIQQSRSLHSIPLTIQLA